MNSIPTFILTRKDEIRQLCMKLSVSHLSIFGSALRQDFNEQNSDLDFLVEFNEPDSPGISDRYLAMADGLEKIFNRPVDLITKPSIRNRVFLETVNSTSRLLYAA